MRNVHCRFLGASIERVRPWIESAWTGTARDPFPRDVIATWRKNPPDVDPFALLPEVTRVGHGAFSFRFESWDGERWRVRVETPSYQGWHGFDLQAVPGGCKVTHAIELDLSGAARVIWPVLIAPIHDWCVEALLDRIEDALLTGTVPAETRRTMPLAAAASLRVFQTLRVFRVGTIRRRRKARARAAA